VTLFDEGDLVPAAPSEPLVRVRLLFAYRGTRFKGAATTPGVRTVAGVLTGAIERVLQAPVRLVLAGRTDAGVHAWGQVASFDAPADAAGSLLPTLAARITKMVQPDIVVRAADQADPGFDARFSAVARSYRYSVLGTPVPDPFVTDTAWWVHAPLDLRAMQLACDAIIGTHDFASFCRAVERRTTERSVRSAEWIDLGEGRLRFDITASSYCQQMVRSLVGTMVDVGLGKRVAGEMAATLRARDRAFAGQVAPAHGLCLWHVQY